MPIPAVFRGCVHGRRCFAQPSPHILRMCGAGAWNPRLRARCDQPGGNTRQSFHRILSRVLRTTRSRVWAPVAFLVLDRLLSCRVQSSQLFQLNRPAKRFPIVRLNHVHTNSAPIKAPAKHIVFISNLVMSVLPVKDKSGGRFENRG